MDLSALQMARMSRLLDEALPLGEAGRRSWLQELGAEHRDLEPALRQALLPDGQRGGADALAKLPKFGSGDDANPIGASGLRSGAGIGPYELIRPLGVGGMAEVWLARYADGALRREVALKLPLLSGLRRDLEPRFAREREILGRFTHPNIARLYDAGFTQHGQPYLALEYVDGMPLTTYCDNHRLTLKERLELFRQVLNAVEYAHANLVIHRDLKPSNILVTEEGQVQLLDFGIAKLLSDGEAKETELTQLSGRALTPDYAAPEQIAGAPITTAADVYSLGVMLYELLTGERPYRLKRDSRGALEEAILQTEPVALSHVTIAESAAQARGVSAKKLSRALKGDLDTITGKALKKHPSERYATANAFGEDIARFLSGEVVLARRDSFAYRAVKFVRRHRVAIAGVGVLILTLAGGLAATTYEARVASAQRDAALQAQLRSLTQTAAARLRDADVAGAMGIILEVLSRRGTAPSYTPEALNTFQEARAADAQIMVISGHTDVVQTAAFSPDGMRIVTASLDKTARIWDAATGRQIMLIGGHADQVWSAAFSPDGRRIVTASLDKTARIWDAAMGRQIVLLRGHTDRVWCAAFSSDSSRVVTTSFDKTARVWDAATGRQTAELRGHSDSVVSAAFSPDARSILTASVDGTARIWDVETGRQRVLISGRLGRLWSAGFSPDGRRVVTASDDKTARVWDAATGRQIMLLSGHTGRLWSAAFSPDGQRIVTASLDTTARIWDAATGRQIMLLSGHTGRLWSAAFSPDGQRIITASDDKTARIWDASTHPEVLLLSGHSDIVESGVFSPDGLRIITASDDKSARIWDSRTGRQLVLLSGHADIVSSADFSPDGRHVVTASDDKSARIWDSDTGRQLVQLGEHADLVESARFSPDGRRVVTASDDKSARIWDSDTGRQLVLLRGHAGIVESAAFSPDGQRVVTASDDMSVRIWDSDTGRQLMLLRGHAGIVGSAAFSPGGRRVVTASNDKTARIWDASTGRQLMLLRGHGDTVESAAFSSDGQRVVTASTDKTARIWDASTGQQLMLLSGHTDRVLSAAFSPDGSRILTASDDRTARIWDARAPAVEDQIKWAEAAQFDPLSGTERFQLGLPAATGVHQWPSAAKSECDDLAAAPYDPDRRAPGAMLGQVVADIAVAACTLDKGINDQSRTIYQRGRALMASGNFPAARREFEAALAGHYRAAGIDLAMLLLHPLGGTPDFSSAITLFERAWDNGVPIAAFELGTLYEHGVIGAGSENEYLLAPNLARAWSWYQKAAQSGEPNALGRLAERDREAAVAENNAANRTSRLLDSFRYYATAVERARIEDWPDDSWREWLYNRASLARLLARDGMMQQVADTYTAVLNQWPHQQPTWWQR